MKQEDIYLYLAGGLFNAGERLHNLMLEKHFKAIGYKVILPQREALRFFSDVTGSFDIAGIVADCQDKCSQKDVVYVGCADGADADSGAAVEFGIAVTVNGRAVVYRTDFRTALEKELGVNAMLRPKGTIFIYNPCFFTELEDVDAFYRDLALRIHQAILQI